LHFISAGNIKIKNCACFSYRPPVFITVPGGQYLAVVFNLMGRLIFLCQVGALGQAGNWQVATGNKKPHPEFPGTVNKSIYFNTALFTLKRC
jgi:hypothetical protein